MEDETRKSNLRCSYLKKMINIIFEFNKFKIRKIEFIPDVDSELRKTILKKVKILISI